jgi:hypothetical protein
VALYIHSPIRLHGEVPNRLSTGTTLPLWLIHNGVAWHRDSKRDALRCGPPLACIRFRAALRHKTRVSNSKTSFSSSSCRPATKTNEVFLSLIQLLEDLHQHPNSFAGILHSSNYFLLNVRLLSFVLSRLSALYFVHSIYCVNDVSCH